MRTLIFIGILFPALAIAGVPRASSTGKDDDGTHSPMHAFDGLLTTGWAEGAKGAGEGEWIELPFDRITDVKSVSFWPGNMTKGDRTIREYGRPHTVTVTLKVPGGEDVVQSARVLDRGPQRIDVAIEGRATAVRLELTKVNGGGIHNDTWISEVAVNFSSGDQPGAVDKVQTWLDSSVGQGAADKGREAVIALYDKIKAEDFGDRDALHALMDRAGDGAPYLRKKVSASVPYGFRVQALPPDDSAIEALLKLKDSNAIEAIERAALRSSGKAENVLWQQVEVFKAHQELVGGGSLNVPPFGQTGFEKGALRAFGEPLDLVVDSYGGVYVADIGNNRIQRFSFNGISERIYGGGDPVIAKDWFHRGRTWYASGQAPGLDEGAFVNPVSVVLMPNKESDQVAVLDAKGRVQVLDADGGTKLLYQLSAEFPISPEVGGEGHIMWKKGRLVTIWSNEGWVHDLNGEEIGHFELEDGAPTCAVMFGSGKFGLCYRDEMVVYDTDGYRHGDIMGGALGDGFELWDATLDEKGKLWAATDNGWVIKFKKPGKVEYKVRFTDQSVDVPRLAVFDSLAFISSDDHIVRVDALELHAVAEQ
jgi:hypothetical protein